VLASLCRYRNTRPEQGGFAQLISVASVGAYRITVVTHDCHNQQLAERLRAALALLGAGLDRESSWGS
jgi:hypothetical protein